MQKLKKLVYGHQLGLGDQGPESSVRVLTLDLCDVDYLLSHWISNQNKTIPPQRNNNKKIHWISVNHATGI